MRIVLQPSGACLELLPGERILDGARRLGYDVTRRIDALWSSLGID